ncbi:MAG: hypothetical protein JWR50_1766 [Mucilaginibacter sp.]|nr:hypothetical protein [Mucilaginibacter sp.]
MKNSLKAVALALAISTSLYACSSNASKNIGDTVKAIKGDTITVDSAVHGETSTTTTKTETSITVDPGTNDSTIVTKTVIKHAVKK